MDLAKIGDKVVCKCNGGPHKIVSGASTVFVDDIPAARIGDMSSCGATITTGADWFEIEDSPAAINGSKTSCGGQVITGSSVSTGSPTSIQVGGFTFQQSAPTDSIMGSDATDNAIAASGASASQTSSQPAIAPSTTFTEETNTYCYALHSSSFSITQTAYLPVEGVGINGGFTFKGNIAIRDGSLFVSAQGFSPASRIGSVIFTLQANLLDGGEIIQRVLLNNDGVKAWPIEPEFMPIGSATLMLPEPDPAKSLSLQLEGSYLYEAPEGSATPLPFSTDKTFDIHVVRK